MIFEQIPVGPMKNFAYLIGDEDSREAAIVDPAWEVPNIISIAKKHGLKITKIFITHIDFDHIEGVPALLRETNAPIFIHRIGVPDIKNMGIDEKDIIAIEEGSLIKIGAIQIKILHTPGHRPSNVCFLIDNKKLITGDTLFVEGCGRVDFPNSDIQKQWDSLQRLKKIDDAIEIYPGHDYGSVKHSTIGHEKKHNPFLLCESFEEFLRRR